MGLNTISTYVFWNYHETQAGEYDFKGEKDVMEFVRLCGAEDTCSGIRQRTQPSESRKNFAQP